MWCKMAPTWCFWVMLVLGQVMMDCRSAALHQQGTVEREEDGSYRPRDADHYGDSGHNPDFDHEAILGSVKEAEEFDRLSPEEAKIKLGILVKKMDTNQDQFIDRGELKKWILKSFKDLAREETVQRLEEVDDDKDGLVTWGEYLQDTFGVDTEEEVSSDDTAESGMLVQDEKEMWKAADVNQDGVLDIEEFEVFTNPEDHDVMHPHLIEQTLREKDKDKDGVITFQEYVGDRAADQDREWLVAERARFDAEFDSDRDGQLNRQEVKRWIIPDNDEVADEEVDHLMASADDDHDDLLSYAEVIEHYDVFVGSDADDSLGERFDDEL